MSILSSTSTGIHKPYTKDDLESYGFKLFWGPGTRFIAHTLTNTHYYDVSIDDNTGNIIFYNHVRRNAIKLETIYDLILFDKLLTSIYRIFVPYTIGDPQKTEISLFNEIQELEGLVRKELVGDWQYPSMKKIDLEKIENCIHEYLKEYKYW